MYFLRYQVSQKDLLNNFGGGLLSNYYESSPIKLLSTIYSDFNFLPWLFTACPRSFFQSRNNRNNYLEWLINKVKIKSQMELTKEHFLQNGGGGLLVLFGGSPLRIINSLSVETDKKLKANSLKRKPRGFWVSLFTNLYFQIFLFLVFNIQE